MATGGFNWHGDTFASDAAADLSTKMFHVADLDANGAVIAAAAGGGFGILQNDPKLGMDATVQYRGISKAVAGAAIAIKAQVASDANGRLRTAIATDIVIGRALAAAVANGDIIPIMLFPIGIK